MLNVMYLRASHFQQGWHTTCFQVCAGVKYIAVVVLNGTVYRSLVCICLRAHNLCPKYVALRNRTVKYVERSVLETPAKHYVAITNSNPPSSGHVSHICLYAMWRFGLQTTLPTCHL